MIELWSAQQHEWLAALGHEVLVQGALPVAENTPATAARRSPAAGQRAGAPQQPARSQRARPEAGQMPPARPSRPAAGRPPDRLQMALIRASGCNPSAPGAEQLIAQWPPAAQLRGNPAAKRALWPILRALRRPAPR